MYIQLDDCHSGFGCWTMDFGDICGTANQKPVHVWPIWWWRRRPLASPHTNWKTLNRLHILMVIIYHRPKSNLFLPGPTAVPIVHQRRRSMKGKRISLFSLSLFPFVRYYFTRFGWFFFSVLPEREKKKTFIEATPGRTQSRTQNDPKNRRNEKKYTSLCLSGNSIPNPTKLKFSKER